MEFDPVRVVGEIGGRCELERVSRRSRYVAMRQDIAWCCVTYARVILEPR